MPLVEDAAEAAEEAFKRYPFDTDEAWQRFRRAAEVTAPSAEVEERLRRAFFRRYIDASLPLKPQSSRAVPADAAAGERTQFARTCSNDWRQRTWKCVQACRQAAWAGFQRSGASDLGPVLDLCILVAATGTFWMGTGPLVGWTWVGVFLSLAWTCHQSWQRLPREWPGRVRLERALASADLIPRLFFVSVGVQLHHPVALRLAMASLIITFVYDRLLPLFESATASAQVLRWFLAPTKQRHLAAYLRQHESRARLLAAYAEAALFIFLLASIFTPQRSFLAVLVLYRYLQLRYLSCPFTRLVWQHIEMQLDMWSTWLPPTLRELYGRAKTVLMQTVGATRLQTPTASTSTRHH